MQKIIEQMDSALEIGDYNTVLSLKSLSGVRGNGDDEISMRYLKASEMRGEYLRKLKVEKIEMLSAKILESSGSERSNHLEKLAEVDPGNETFRDEIRSLKEEKKRNEAKNTSVRSTSSYGGLTYEGGYRDGYMVGRADARDGYSRRGVWAKENGERLSSPGSSYSKGYHLGYNEGYHSYR